MKKIINKLLGGGKIKKYSAHNKTDGDAYKSNNGNFLVFFAHCPSNDEINFCLRTLNEDEDFKHYSFNVEHIETKIAIVGHYLGNKVAEKI